MSEIDNANFIEKDKCYLVYDDFGDFRGVVLTADVFEVVHGKWEDCEIVQEDGDYKIIDEWQSARCSVCGKYHTTPYMYHFDHFNYCPNCGTKMGR